MNYLIYLVYGGEDYNNEALFSLLSYYNHHTVDENQVVIYTDDSTFFKHQLPENVLYVDINDTQLQKWRQPHGYIHRVKVKVLQDAAGRFNGNILYVDTDTVFRSNCSTIFSEISNGMLFLDKCEGKLFDNPGGIAKKMRKFLSKQSTFSIGSYPEPIHLTAQFMAYNSGAIGFNSDRKDILIQVEELIDELYSKNPLFVMEQIAFSYFFQINHIPSTTESHIHHYWYFKEFRGVLKEFFQYHKGKPFMELQDEVYKLDPEQLAINKRAYKKLPFWKKQWQKISKGRKWDMPKYEL